MRCFWLVLVGLLSFPLGAFPGENPGAKAKSLTELARVSDLAAWKPEGGAGVRGKGGARVLRLVKESEGSANPQVFLEDVALKPNTRYRLSFKVNSEAFGSHFQYGVKYSLSGTTTTANRKFINEQSASFLAAKQLLFHTPPADGFDHAVFYISLHDADTLYIRDIELKEAAAKAVAREDVVWEVITPCHRNTIYPSQSISAIEAVAELAPSYKASSYTVSFQDADGNVLFKQDVSADNGKVHVSVPVDADMEAGNYGLAIQGNHPEQPMESHRVAIQKLPESGWEVRVDKEGFVVVNGKRIFLVGTKQWLPPAYMNDLGVNVLFYSDYTPLDEKEKFLSDMHRYLEFGVYAFDNNRYYCSVENRATKEELQKKLADALNGTLDTPGFLGFMADEPLWIGIPVEEMRAFYECLKAMAPNLLGLVNHAPRGTVEDLGEYLPCDIASVDIYPVPKGNGHSVLENKTISCVGDYMEKQKAYINGRHMSPMMYLQGFAARGQYPSYGELRFMAFQSIVHGARGLSFWVEQNINLYSIPAFYDIAHKVLNEIRALGGVLTLSDSPEGVVIGREEIAALCKEGGGEAFLICVNESNSRIKDVEISHPALKNIKKLHVLSEFSEHRTIPCNEGRVVDHFEPYAVRIYAVTREIPSTPTPRLAGAKDQRVLNARLKEYIKQGLVDPQWKSAEWIWPGDGGKSSGYVRREFTLDEVPVVAVLNNAVITHYELYVNGTFVDWDRWYYKPLVYDITKLLKEGKNVIAYRVRGMYGPDRGLMAKLGMEFSDGRKETMASGPQWLGVAGNGTVPENWREPGFDASSWEPCGKPVEGSKHDRKNFSNSFLYDYEADR